MPLLHPDAQPFSFGVKIMSTTTTPTAAQALLVEIALPIDMAKKLDRLAERSGARSVQVAALAIASLLEDDSETAVRPTEGLQAEAWEANTRENWHATYDARFLRPRARRG